MTIRKYLDNTPQIDGDAWVDPDASVIGDVTLAAHASVWPAAVLRGDVQSIEVGARSNIQDGSVLHVTHDGEFSPGGRGLVIGEDVTIGHNVTLHACTIGNGSLVGMGSIVLDGAVLEAGCMLAAGSLVSPGKVLQGGFLWQGSPARKVRELRQSEKSFLVYSAGHYIKLAQQHRDSVGTYGY